MANFEILIFILFIVVLVTAVAENINIPYPILLVITGMLVGFIPNLPNWQPPNNLILPIFLPPILFSAARTISWHDIKNYPLTIFSLAFVLVYLTMLVVAATLYFFIPEMKWNIALLLGAIVSPTDVIASLSILGGLQVKTEIIRVIKVESLFNDAAAVFFYKMALIMVISASGSHNNAHPWHPGIILMGILIGFSFAFIANTIIKYFLTSSENDLAIILGIVLAYISYLFAQEIEASGVIAVVTAGLFYKKATHRIRATTRLAEKAVWDSLLFFLNGLIFISIGVELPNYFKQTSHLSTSMIFLISILTILTMMTLRFFWILLTNFVTLYFKNKKNQTIENFDNLWKNTAVTTWAGLRGLVSITIALALPTTLENGQPFYERSLIIIVTIVVILFTLVGQGLSLPLVIKILNVRKKDDTDKHRIQEVYQLLNKKALRRLSTFIHHPETPSEEARRLVEDHYSSKLLFPESLTYDTESQKKQIKAQQQADLLLARSLQYQRDALLRLYGRGEISEEIYLKVLNKLDKDEVSFTQHS